MRQVSLDSLDKDALRRHMFGSYISLRIGMAVIAFVFPILLFVSAKLKDIPLQGSMSAYFWASPGGDPPSRMWFVGSLFTLGAFLYLYKGFTAKENVALNLAALFAIGVACFPMEWNCDTAFGRISPVNVTHCVDGWNPHGACAAALFVCLAYVTCFRSLDTLPALKDKGLETRFRNWYWCTTAAMAAAPLSAIALHLIIQKYDTFTYLLELTGIWAFALYWMVKTYEMRRSQAEEKVLQGRGIG